MEIKGGTLGEGNFKDVLSIINSPKDRKHTFEEVVVIEYKIVMWRNRSG